MPFSDQRPAVYTTGIGRIPICKRCHLPQTECRCRETATEMVTQAPRDGFVRISRDRKGRRGKTMTLVSNLPDDDSILAEVTQHLKKLCGSGGTCKEQTIAIQGDHRDKIEAWLIQQGYKVKRVGG
jgi:translation initiation factor 1